MRHAVAIRVTCAVALVVALPGCGKLLGISDLRATTGDAGGDAVAPDASAASDAATDAASDAAVDTPAGGSTISGTIRIVDGLGGAGNSTGVGNAPLSLFSSPEDVQVSSTTSEGGGPYKLSFPSFGISGYIVGGPLGTYRPTRRYLPRRLFEAVTADVDLYAVSAIQAFAAVVYGLQQSELNSFVVVLVLEPDGTTPAANVVVEVPAGVGAVRYSSGSASSTSSDGIAYLFNIPPEPGPFRIDAVRPGTTTVGFEIDLPPETNAQVTLPF